MTTPSLEIDLNNIPDDPSEAMKLFESLERGIEPTAAAPAPTPAAPATPDPVAAPVAAAAQAPVQAAPEQSTPQNPAAQAADPEPAGVATKDGKHVIPYSVLTDARDRATRAEAAITEANEKVAALERSLQAVANGANPGAAPLAAQPAAASAPAMSDADLDALKEDFPTVYNALKAQQAYLAALEAQVKEGVNFRSEVEAATQRSVEETVQDAIDANPKLAFIQSKDTDAFALAQQFDDTLKNAPGWRNRPMSERFAKVIEMVEQTNGAITLPAPASKQEPTPTTAVADLKAQAKAAAAAAATAAKTGVPTSLSEFPVGDPPAQTETQALEQMSQQQLAEKFMRMTPDQQNAYFASLN